jgi:hypothetical protein
MSTNHTPGPWRVTDADGCTDGDDIKATILADSGRLICHIDRDYRAPAEANAAHIVRCVNAHDELVAALRMIDKAQADCVRYADVPGSGTDWCTYCLELANIARAALARVQA